MPSLYFSSMNAPTTLLLLHKNAEGGHTTTVVIKFVVDIVVQNPCLSTYTINLLCMHPNILCLLLPLNDILLNNF